MAQGRDQLASGGLYTLQLDLAEGDWGAGLWQGWGDQANYQESDAYLQYAPVFGRLEPFLSLTRLRFGPQGDYDTEVAGGGEWHLTPWLLPGVEATYSRQSDGSFVLLTLRAEKALTPTLEAGARLSQGLDYGYASNGHDGANHRQLDLALTWHWQTRLSFYLGGHHSWAGEDVRREGGGNLSWLDMGLSAYF
ncbi:MAG: hypothetical protein R3292_08445 [Alcanivorax sp.]|nr:hypothetical protein [Alcanivorax sp.]